MFRKTIWRGSWAIIGATIVACLYCAANSVETTPFGILVSPFVALSVVSFLLLERSYPTRFVKYLGFFVPVLVIGGGCCYQIWSLRSQLVLEGIGEGAEEIYIYFAESYGIGLFVAFGFLLLGEVIQRVLTTKCAGRASLDSQRDGDRDPHDA